MGRGRQKAKQTKVARELKYHSSSIDVTALQRELAGDVPASPPPAVDRDQNPDSGDTYSEDPYSEDPYSTPEYDDDEDDGPGQLRASS